MQRTGGTFLLLAAALLAASCGEQGGGGGGSTSSVTPSPSTTSTLVGTWRATRAEFVNAANSGQRVEVVSQGTTVTLALDSAGSYTQRIVDVGQAGQTTTGTWTASTDVLQLRPTGMSWSIQFDMTFSGANLTLNGGHVQFDFNSDGQGEEALAYLTMVRQ